MRATRLVVLGLSHHTASVELREALSCSHTMLQPLLAPAGSESLFPAGGPYAAIRELAILSTCNRLELYATVDHAASGWQPMLAALLSDMRGIPTARFYKHLYTHIGYEVAQHLFRVAAGLDSRILGEAQILGQVTGAYTSSIAARTSGETLKALFEAAIRVGKRARTETNIGKNPASTSSMALAQAESLLGSLHRQRVLVIGMGEMGQLALKGLADRGVRQVVVANRSLPRAEAAARRHGLSEVAALADLPRVLADVDVVVSATAAPQPVLTAAMVAEALRARPDRPLVLLDIAVPRDVETAAADLPGVHLFDADQLHASLDQALQARQAEVPCVEAVIVDELQQFVDRVRELAIQPVIAGLRLKAEAIRQRELDRALRHLGEVDPDTLAQFQHLSRSLVNKLLHEPTLQLRSKARENEAAVYAETVRDLFGLPR